MKHLYQGRADHKCGHTCVAMLANTTSDRVAQVLGHERPTAWLELYSVLHVLGVVCEPKQIPCFEPQGMPEVALVIIPSGTPVLKHVVVKYGDLIYDPAVAAPYPAAALPFELEPANQVLTCAKVYNVAVIPGG